MIHAEKQAVHMNTRQAGGPAGGAAERGSAGRACYAEQSIPAWECRAEHPSMGVQNRGARGV